MRHDQEGHFSFPIQFDEELSELIRRMSIERPSWFVRQDEGGLVDQGTDDRDPLAFPSGQLARPVGEPVVQTDPPEQFLRAPLRIAIGGRIAGGQGGNQDIFQNRTLRQEMMRLKNETDLTVAQRGDFVLVQGAEILPAQRNPSTTRTIEGADDVEERAFSGAGRADDCDRLPFDDLQGDGVEDDNGREVLTNDIFLADIGELKQGRIFGHERSVWMKAGRHR